MKEAVHMAPLYTRLLFRAISAAEGWEARVPNEVGELAKEDLLYWRDVLLHQSGKSRARRQAMFHVARDNSGTWYAGYSDLLHAPVVLSYDVDEWAALQANPHSLSSLHRETQNAKLTLQTVILHATTVVTGGLLVLGLLGVRVQGPGLWAVGPIG